jgi:hypothetical protein
MLLLISHPTTLPTYISDLFESRVHGAFWSSVNSGADWTNFGMS